MLVPFLHLYLIPSYTAQLNVEEFKEALRIHLNKAVPIEQVMPAFQKFDKTGDGKIDMQEFVLALVR